MTQVIAGVEVAPGEVKCGVVFSLMEPRREWLYPSEIDGEFKSIGRAFHGDL